MKKSTQMRLNGLVSFSLLVSPSAEVTKQKEWVSDRLQISNNVFFALSLHQ